MTNDKKDQLKPSPNVSGSYQVVNDQEKTDLEELLQNKQLDEESMYYTRIFNEE